VCLFSHAYAVTAVHVGRITFALMNTLEFYLTVLQFVCFLIDILESLIVGGVLL